MVLVISQKKSRARDLCELFKYAGIPSYPITVAEAYNEISPMYRAVIIIEPSFICDVAEFIGSMRKYLSNIPYFAFYYSEIGPESSYFDDSFSGDSKSGNLLTRMLEYMEKGSFSLVGDYRLAGINASIDQNEVIYFDKTVNLSKTEKMILRFLIRSYPLPRKPEMIIKYVYKPSKAPDISSVRTHICKINAKFKSVHGEVLISSPKSAGYVIYTPILREKYEN